MNQAYLSFLARSKNNCLLGTVLILISSLCVSNVWAVDPVPASSSPSSKSLTLDYPELAVVPKASERLNLESRGEGSSWTLHLPIQLSGVLTLSTGVASFISTSQEKVPDYIPGVVASGVGLFWTVGPYFLGSKYLPYTRAKKNLASLPKASLEDRLSLERLAEEELASASRVAKILRWSSIATQSGANLYVLAMAPKKSMAQMLSAVSLIGAWVPLFIDHDWETVWDSQREYKKKIYGPIPGARIQSGSLDLANLDFGSLDIAPTLGLTIEF